MENVVKRAPKALSRYNSSPTHPGARFYILWSGCPAPFWAAPRGVRKFAGNCQQMALLAAEGFQRGGVIRLGPGIISAQ